MKAFIPLLLIGVLTWLGAVASAPQSGEEPMDEAARAALTTRPRPTGIPANRLTTPSSADPQPPRSKEDEKEDSGNKSLEGNWESKSTEDDWESKSKEWEKKSKEDKSKENKSKEDKSKENKSKEDKSKENKSKEDKSKEDKSKKDKSKEDKSKEDKSQEDYYFYY